MKTIFRRAAVALSLLVLAAAAQAQISADVAEKLMRSSGLWKQLEVIGPQFRTGMEQGLKAPGADVPDDARTRMLAAADTAFQATRLRASMVRTLVEGVRANQVPALTAWYDGAIGRQVTALEEDSERLGESTESRAQAGVALLQAASPERRALLARLVEISRAAQAGTDTFVQMAIGVQLGLSRFVPDKPRPSEAEMRATLEAQRPQLQRAMEGLTLAMMAHTYRALPDDALAAYAGFMGSAAGDHYTDIATRAFQDALQEALATLKP